LENVVHLFHLLMLMLWCPEQKQEMMDSLRSITVSKSLMDIQPGLSLILISPLLWNSKCKWEWWLFISGTKLKIWLFPLSFGKWILMLHKLLSIGPILKTGLVNVLLVNINPPSDSQEWLLNLLKETQLNSIIDGLMELKLGEIPLEMQLKLLEILVT